MPATPLPNASSKRKEWSVSCIILSGLAFTVLLVITVVAQLGLVRVPLLSAGYTPPQPTRVIANQKTIDAEAFRTLVALRLQTYIRQHPRPPYHLVLTEQELTGALRGAIGEALRGPGVTQEHLQVVILPDAFEFSGQFSVGWLHLDAVARMRPVVQDGGIRFEPAGVRVGRLRVPDAVAMKLLSLALSREVGVWQISASGISVHSVSLKTGSADIELSQK